ncbi:hypothetical protein DLAC_01439 [Tieghemostelium lacteum]|uniref:FNIP repeat-containing protein n=1 Tax=Tieghemostelium lacteum TaxID=361077 RepID=A0A152A5W2_TIELA|nr:hypothetical protein DLAC_01439 [Tieghemostelium lacteum]|eukprot:KYR01457.1 hypothetical protein DLAC_01439 [Tieghemostelium lacteum]
MRHLMTFPLLLIRCICEQLDNDVDIIFFLSSCKQLYSNKDKITFNNFPVNFYLQNYNETASENNQMNIPNKFRILLIDAAIGKIKSFKSFRFDSVYINNDNYKEIPSSDTVTKLFILQNRFSFDPLLLSTTSITDLSITTYGLIPNFEWSHLPPSLTSLNYNNRNPPLLKAGDLKPPLRKLKLNTLNQQISKDLFPDTLVHFETTFNQNITVESLPERLEILHFDVGDNTWMVLSFPETLKILTLSFSCSDSQIQCQRYPYGLLEFTSHYLQTEIPVGLFTNLKYLCLTRYNQDLQHGVLPKTLTCLSLNSFDRPLKVGDIPDGITELTLKDYQPVIISSSSSTEHPLPKSLQLLRIEEQKFILVPGSFPNNYPKFQNLTFQSFNQHIGRGIFPSSLRNIHLGHYFYSNVEMGSLPLSLEFLSFPFLYSVPLGNGVISTETTPHLNTLRNLSNCIPQILNGDFRFLNLKSISVDGLPIDAVEYLPHSLEELILRFGICGKLDGTVAVELSYKFYTVNQKLPFPPSLLHLNFGLHFNSPLSEVSLPPNLEYIELDSDIDITFFISTCKKLYSLRGKIRYNIFPTQYYLDHQKEKSTKWFYKKLLLPLKYKRISVAYSPSTVTDLSVVSDKGAFGFQWSNIPPLVKSLRLSVDKLPKLCKGDLKAPLETLKLPYQMNQTLSTNLFPKTLRLEVLFIQYAFNHSLLSFPETLKTLILPNSYRPKTELSAGHLPDSITNLTLGELNTTQSGSEHVLPLSLKHLKLTDQETILEPRTFPNNQQIISLDFDIRFNQPIKNLLPNTLKTLFIGREFEQKIELDTFPNSIETIIFHDNYCHDIPIGIFTYEMSNLKKLILSLNFAPAILKGVLQPLTNLIELKIEALPYESLKCLPRCLEILTLRYGIYDNIEDDSLSLRFSQNYYNFKTIIGKDILPPS